MARLVFGGDDVTYRSGSNTAILAQSGRPAYLYLDALLTQPALDLQTYPDHTPVTTGFLTVNGYSQLPFFYGPDGIDTLYAVVNGGPVTAIYARVDDRIDLLAATKVTGSGSLTSGTVLPSSPALGDLHGMPGPNYDPVTQFPWDWFVWADRLALPTDSQVAQYTDLSGFNRHATPVSSNLPLFRPKVAKIGNRAAVEFDAALNTALRTPTWTVGSAQPNTLVIVGRFSDVSQCLIDTADPTLVQRLSRASNGDFNMKGSTAATIAAPGDSRPHCFVDVYNGATSTLYVDGAVVATGDAGGNSLRGITLGARNDLGVPTGGYIAMAGAITDLFTADQLTMFHWFARSWYTLPWAGI